MKIRFERLALENFALFPQIEVDLAVEDSRPLTLIRGENQSGKTTLMRGFVWLLFGEKYVPAVADAMHPLRPPWAMPDERVRTKAELRFTVFGEGSARVYKLIRKGLTEIVGGKVRYVEDPNDGLRLLIRDEVAGFQEQAELVRVLQRKYFPAEMREFILIDADKAQELVGGPESSHDDTLMRRTTTAAVGALLGVGPLKRVAKRLRDEASERLAAAARNSGNRDLERLEEEHASAKRLAEETKTRRDQLEEQVEALREAHRSEQQVRERQLAEYEETQVLQEQLADAKMARQELISARSQEIDVLASILTAEQAMAVLLLPKLDSIVARLDGLKSEGRIPPAELTLLPRILRENRCVCGLDLEEFPDRRREIERRIELSDPNKHNAEFADQILESARDLANRAIGPASVNWAAQVAAMRAALGELDGKISAATSEIEERETELSGAARSSGGGLAQVVTSFDELTATLHERERALEQAEERFIDAVSDQRSASEKIRNAQARTAALEAARRAAQAANDLADVIDRARLEIETQQVTELDEAVNSVFRDVISATDTSHFKRVGIRALGAENLAYEPYAIGATGQEKPMAIANGASRRAIATSIVLALSEVTGTSIPFVADSLLHSMSGSVKRKLVRYLAAGDRVGQPILFGTRNDLLDVSSGAEGESVLDIIKRQAGVTYTLTSQADVGGEVVHADPEQRHPLEAVLCKCGPDQYCDICERLGDEVSPYLHRVNGVNR